MYEAHGYKKEKGINSIMSHTSLLGMEVDVRKGGMRYNAELGLGVRITFQMRKAEVRLLDTRDTICRSTAQNSTLC